MNDVPSRFGDYLLVEKLGVGGMGEIFRAVRAIDDGKTPREVVIKRILSAYVTTERYLAAFQAEATVTRALNHPNVVKVYEYGQVEGQPYLVLESVVGRSLKQIIHRAKICAEMLPVGFALHVIVEVLKALQHAHTRVDAAGNKLHIVHRDVSPDNVLISFAGEVKLLDFGIAKANVDRPETEPGLVKGKYHYFPPEQARGGVLDARSDVYAAGSVLHELLTGRPRLDGRMLSVMRKLANAELPPVHETAPELEGALSACISRAMAADRVVRYPSALAFQQDLARVMVKLTPETSRQTVVDTMRRLFAKEVAELGPRPVSRPAELPTQVVLHPTEKVYRPTLETVADRPIREHSPLASPPTPPADAYDAEPDPLVNDDSDLPTDPHLRLPVIGRSAIR